MSVSSYQQRSSATESPKALELRAFGFVTHGLKSATDVQSRITALHKNHQLWLTLVTDLANPDNGLPNDLKARLISLGFWSMRFSLRAMEDEAVSLAPLIDVNTQIAAGLTDSMRAAAAPTQPPSGQGPVQTAV